MHSSRGSTPRGPIIRRASHSLRLGPKLQPSDLARAADAVAGRTCERQFLFGHFAGSDPLTELRPLLPPIQVEHIGEQFLNLLANKETFHYGIRAIDIFERLSAPAQVTRAAKMLVAFFRQGVMRTRGLTPRTG